MKKETEKTTEFAPNWSCSQSFSSEIRQGQPSEDFREGRRLRHSSGNAWQKIRVHGRVPLPSVSFQTMGIVGRGEISQGDAE